ncbi:MAG: hypothetical protein IT364_08125 [Candidatus Hydrogenedentes bacterium]|nr:hypothetical protein [Candidatus Hydrogenedentota bacterium]
MSHTMWKSAIILVAAIVTAIVSPVWASESADHENCPHAQGGGQGACCEGHAAASPLVEKPAITWEVPEHWVKARPRPFREATYHPSGQEETECYVTVVPADAGSAVETINRWRGQLGLEPLSKSEIEAGPSTQVLDGKGLLIEAFGDLTDLGGNVHEDYGLLSMVCVQDGTLFIVRMTGPREQVQSERDHFMAFLGSIAESSTA